MLELYNNGTRSLKEKRRLLANLKATLRREFNVAIAEIGEQDKWQRTKIAVVCVSNDASRNRGLLQRIVHFVGKNRTWEIIDYRIEEVR